MERLDRAAFRGPTNWTQYVTGQLGPVFGPLQAASTAFEQVLHTDPVRQRGFGAYAGTVLPILAKKKADRGFPPLWQRHPTLKANLAEWSAGHCAYCQCPEMSSGHGEVEHFKPKSQYPTLVYDLDNYFLGCKRCNLSKLDKFPLPHGYLRPDAVDPDTVLTFEANGTVSAAPGNPAAVATVADLALNRTWLVNHRRMAIATPLGGLVKLMARTALSLPLQRELALERMPEPLTAYSAAVRQVLRRVWNLAHPSLAI